MEMIRLLLGGYSQGQWILAKNQTATAGNYLLWRQSNFILCAWKLRYNIGYIQLKWNWILNQPEERIEAYVFALDQVWVSSSLFYLPSLVHGFIGSILSSLTAMLFCYYCSYIAYLVTVIIVFFSLAEDKKKCRKISRCALEESWDWERNKMPSFPSPLKKPGRWEGVYYHLL